MEQHVAQGGDAGWGEQASGTTRLGVHQQNQEEERKNKHIPISSGIEILSKLCPCPTSPATFPRHELNFKKKEKSVTVPGINPLRHLSL